MIDEFLSLRTSVVTMLDLVHVDLGFDTISVDQLWKVMHHICCNTSGGMHHRQGWNASQSGMQYRTNYILQLSLIWLVWCRLKPKLNVVLAWIEVKSELSHSLTAEGIMMKWWWRISHTPCVATLHMKSELFPLQAHLLRQGFTQPLSLLASESQYGICWTALWSLDQQVLYKYLLFWHSLLGHLVPGGTSSVRNDIFMLWHFSLPLSQLTLHTVNTVLIKKTCLWKYFLQTLHTMEFHDWS